VGTFSAVSDPYRPGQYPSGPDQTTRIPPVQPRPGQPRGPRPRQEGQPPAKSAADKRREYILKGLGLLLVAVVSGMLWWLIQQGRTAPAPDPDATGTQQPAGKFTFARHPEIPKPVRDSNCVEHSYRQVQTFFKGKNCTALIRELYTTTASGKKVYTSVSVVEMATPQDAATLKDLTEKEGTGNVSDLVRENKVKVSGLTNLSSGGFAAKVQDAHVVIVESDFEGGGKPTDEEVLDEISNDALRLGDEMRAS
jgi:hypothetical protein